MIETGRARASVQHLRVRGRDETAALGATVLRLRAERLLSQVDLIPPGLPPGAVLLLRQMTTAAPLSQRNVSAARAEEQVRCQIAELYHTAARPAANAEANRADSVIFSDEAELLACLTRDLLKGQAFAKWYWQPFLRGMPRATGAALAQVWEARAASLPAALGQLEMEPARAAVALLSPREVSAVVRALHQAFDFPETALSRAAAGPHASPPARQSVESAYGGLSSADTVGIHSTDVTAATPPWTHWLPERDATTLSPQAQYLLGLALALDRAPSFARSARFAHQAAVWLDETLFPRQASPEIKPLPVPSREARGEFFGANPQEGTLPALRPLLTELRHPPIESRTGEATSQRVEPKQMPEASRAADAASPSGVHSSGDAPVGPSQVVATNGINEPLRPDEFRFGALEPFPADGVWAELGGILYLINLLIWLDLPGSWSEDSALAEHLSGWAIVEMFARHLLGNTITRFADDPIWALLRTLDGRTADAPIGASLLEPSSFRLPAKWLRSYAPREPRWIVDAAGSRVKLFDESTGYLIADVPCPDQTAEEIALAEVEVYRAQGIQAAWRWGSAPALPQIDAYTASALSPAASWWLERVSGFVRYVLAHTLGEPQPDWDTLGAALLRKPGRLLASRTHVDLYLSMDQISLSIRRAGLDRDPGWVPDLGRIVLFHFD